MLSSTICLSFVTVFIVMVATATPITAILYYFETLLAVVALLDLSVLVGLTELLSCGIFELGLLQSIIELCLGCRSHAYYRYFLLRLVGVGGGSTAASQSLLALAALKLLRCPCLGGRMLHHLLLLLLLLLESLHVHGSGYLCFVSLLVAAAFRAVSIVHFDYLKLLAASSFRSVG